MPARSRRECVDLLNELERRFKGASFWRLMAWLEAAAVRDRVIAPLRDAVVLNSMEALHRAAQEIELRDDFGTDYSFVNDLRARVRVIELEAMYSLEHDGARTPP
jgi:hypothetical protein